MYVVVPKQAIGAPPTTQQACIPPHYVWNETQQRCEYDPSRPPGSPCPPDLVNVPDEMAPQVPHCVTPEEAERIRAERAAALKAYRESPLPWIPVVAMLAAIGVVGGLAWYSTRGPGSVEPNRKSGYRLRIWRVLNGGPTETRDVDTKTEAIKLADRLSDSGRYQMVEVVDRSTGKPFLERYRPNRRMRRNHAPPGWAGSKRAPSADDWVVVWIFENGSTSEGHFDRYVSQDEIVEWSRPLLKSGLASVMLTRPKDRSVVWVWKAPKGLAVGSAR